MTAARLDYTVRFLCPAFLGNAEQSAQWRTPPFKALLRQWWRVAYAADQGFNVNVTAMHQAEGALFGAAADRQSNRSAVRLRLDRWGPGRLTTWQSLPTVWHPEVKRNGETGRQVGSDLYLGYGPLTPERGTTVLKKDKAAIQAGDTAALHIAITSSVPGLESERITKAIGLVNLYGTVGGRSRNGWGSFVLEPLDGTPPPSPLDSGMLRSWRQALALEWPHAIGRQGLEGPALVWETESSFADWKEAMKRLAEIKIAFRTKFPLESPPHPRPLDRHWLSYPVTRHTVDAWGERLRLPNSLRFKLRADAPGAARLRAIIFHVPCLPPPEFAPDRPAITRIWETVHAFLDNPKQQLSRIAA